MFEECSEWQCAADPLPAVWRWYHQHQQTQVATQRTETTGRTAGQLNGALPDTPGSNEAAEEDMTDGGRERVKKAGRRDSRRRGSGGRIGVSVHRGETVVGA